MRIALCLYGVVGGATGKADFAEGSKDVLKLGHEKYKSALLDHYDVDIYLHTWSNEFKEEILELYKPKGHLIEEQEVFDIPPHVLGDDPEQPKRRQGCYSRWRSTQKVLGLKSSSQEQYDFTLLSRYDVGFENKIDFASLDKDSLYLANWWGAKYGDISDIFEDGRGIYYDQKDTLDESKIETYSRGFPHNNEGVMDLWMIGSDNTVNVFETLFDNINQYQAPGEIPWCPRISNHQLLLHHARKNNLTDKLKFITNPLEDHCIIRYKYFGCKDGNISTLLRSDK